MMQRSLEFLSIWPGAPRYCPQKSFPPYHFVPGKNPHPRRSPEGHSYEVPEETPTYFTPDRWRENELYLYGVDLYHYGYLWESHEAWESLWHLTGKDDVEGQFLQGLIQNAAALLKVHVAQWSGAKHLSQEAYRRLEFVVSSEILKKDPLFMGVHVSKFLESLQNYYHFLWQGQQKVVDYPPRIELVGNPQ